MTAVGLTSLPAARAKPPPSSRMMFQGMRSWTTFQFSSIGGASFTTRWRGWGAEGGGEIRVALL